MRSKFQALLTISLFLGGCGFENSKITDQLLELEGRCLGTNWMVKVLTNTQINKLELETNIKQRLEELETIFSHWRHDGAIHQFNKKQSTKPLTINHEIIDLLEHAQWMHQNTSGAFDPTIAPVVNLWGFGPNGKTRSTIPTAQQIEKALSSTGIQKFEILPQKMIQKKVPNLQLDFSASAKGEIIDQICKLLARWGFKNYLVEIGGEVRAEGRGRKGRGWIVGLEDGNSDNNEDMVSVPLRNYAVATSGSYRLNKPNPDSNRSASHLIDPRTGRPIEHDLIAVNAFAPTARDADAWATALMILGPKDGMELAEKMDMVARFSVLNNNSLEIKKSKAYDRLYGTAISK